MAPVQVTVVGEEGQIVDADIYLWNGERDAVSANRWDLDTFIRERLDDWIELSAQNPIACEEDPSGLL